MSTRVINVDWLLYKSFMMSVARMMPEATPPLKLAPINGRVVQPEPRNSHSISLSISAQAVRIASSRLLTQFGCSDEMEASTLGK